MRIFGTGATRHSDAGKLDYEGFLSPLVLERFAEYMDKNRVQADGKVRASDNWQKGIDLPAYMKSLWRHAMDVFKAHRGFSISGTMEDALCGVIFNANGYLHELIIRRLGVKDDRPNPAEVVLGGGAAEAAPAKPKRKRRSK